MSAPRKSRVYGTVHVFSFCWDFMGLSTFQWDAWCLELCYRLNDIYWNLRSPNLLWLHLGRPTLLVFLGKKSAWIIRHRNQRMLKRPPGAHHRKLGLYSLLAGKLVLLLANESYLSTIRSYLLSEAGPAAALGSMGCWCGWQVAT